jgi:hypothetical protein
LIFENLPLLKGVICISASQARILLLKCTEFLIHKAQVDYESLTYADPVAVKIIVKEVFPGATTEWILPLPE